MDRLAELIIGLTVVSYFTRVSMIALVGRVELPSWARDVFRLIVPAVFTALVLPGVFVRGGVIVLSPMDNARIVAALAAALAAWRTRNMIVTLLAGMGTLWVLQAVGLP